MGTARNAAQEGEALGQRVLQLIPGRCFSCSVQGRGTLSSDSNTPYSLQGILSPRVGGTTNVTRDAFDGEVKPLLYERAELHLNKIQPGGCPDTPLDPSAEESEAPRQNINTCRVFVPAGPSSFAQGQCVRSVGGTEGQAPVLWLIKHMPLTQAFGKLCARIKINPGKRKKKK